ncbi:MAG TPA: sugar ABC transporter ATP-binding protein [Solirubrobacteraceae bacterium]|jgi:simple sugar transport system ATP-binding protein/ribose transport system ATP-binding protein|nr:sugar ABC transporter ATP-binding protein [Solirubrobacteraceae bacterium]
MTEHTSHDGSAPALLEARGLNKRFGGVHALNDVNVAIRAGTIHALVGENGAGKSTLGKMLSGVYRPDSGEILIDGELVSMRSVREAQQHGVAIVAQELMLSPHLTVAQNVFLGIESRRPGGLMIDRPASRARYEALRRDTGFDIDGDTPVKALRVAEQQMVEIMRGLARDVRLIIMDEPTAALSRDQAQKLFEVIRGLRARGITIVYVSHFLKEILALTDVITVMRDGQVVSTKPASEHTEHTLVNAMLGRDADVAFPPKRSRPADAPVVGRFTSLSRAPFVEDVSFEVHRGEILGIAGLVGSGRTEVARMIFGADRGAGEVEIEGKLVARRSPQEGMAQGVSLVPESRKDQGLILRRPIIENVTLPHLWDISRFGVISRSKERREANEAIERVDVRGAGPQVQVGQLSGGNQQKVLFAKWLFRQPKILITDEPTRGVDVGAKRAIYDLLHKAADQGTAVIVISSELEEVIGLADRVIAMRQGRVVAEFEGDDVNEKNVLAAVLAAGATPGEAQREINV